MSVTQDFLKAAGGEHSLHSRLGKWASQMAKVIEVGGGSGTSLLGLLVAAQGEVSLHSPFGKMALLLSFGIDDGLIDKKVVSDLYRAMGGARQLLSQYGRFLDSAILRGP